MTRPFLYVSTVIRGCSNGEMSGFFYKIDWRTREILARALSATLNAPLGKTDFGVFRM